MTDSNSEIRFCPKCQAVTERDTRGKCRLCAIIRVAAWRADNPERNKIAVIAWRAANPESKKAYDAAYRTANREILKVKCLEWRAANPEKEKAARRAWVVANPDRKKAYGAKYRSANKEKLQAYHAVWAAANSIKRKAYSAALRAANPERQRVVSAAWRAANPEAGRIREQNRRARKRINGGVLSRNLAVNLFKLQKGMCPCCQQPLGADYHMDHITPIAKGGSNTDDNVQLLRKICNLQKSVSHPIDFMQSRGFLL